MMHMFDLQNYSVIRQLKSLRIYEYYSSVDIAAFSDTPFNLYEKRFAFLVISSFW